MPEMSDQNAVEPAALAQPAGSDRIGWLRQAYGERLFKAVSTDFRALDAVSAFIECNSLPRFGELTDWARDDVFTAYRGVDSTPRGRYLDWVMRLAIAGKLPPEDLPKAKDTLEAFERYKRRLPAEARDIGRYETLGDVWVAVSPMLKADMATSAKDEDRREREAVRGESDIVIEEEDLVVAIPKTERAAKWWGRGTRWCTAADEDNMFATYSKDGPLIVLIIEGKKFQYHRHSEQFMDDADRACNIDKIPDKVRLRIEELSSALYVTIFLDRIERLGRKTVNDSPVVREAILRFGMSTARLPKKHWSEDIALTAVSRGEANISDIPHRLRTRPVLLAAVSRRYSVKDALQQMPPEWIDQGVIDAALATETSSLRVIDSLRPDLVTQELCDRLLRDGPTSLRFIPERFLTKEIAADCLARDPWALYMAPSHLLTKEMIRPIVEAKPFMIRHVPFDLIDGDLCRTALGDGDPMNLRLLPDPILNDVDFCVDALSRAVAMIENGMPGDFEIMKMIDRIPEPVMDDVVVRSDSVMAWMIANVPERRDELERKKVEFKAPSPR